MGKIVKNLLTFFIFLVVSANAATISESISKNVSLIGKSSKSKTVRICHDIKNLYIKSIIKSDKDSQIEAIKGLIKCSKILHKKYKHYEEELSLLSKDKKNLKSIKKKRKPTIKKVPKVRSIKSYHDKIVITFDRDIDKRDVSFFELNGKGRYRDVFDIRARLYFRYKKANIKNIKEIRISQFTKNTIRVVLQDNKPINSIFSIEKNRIIIKVDNPHKKEIKSYTKRYFSPVVTTDKVIIIDPGHGGKDTGAIGYKRLKEKNAVLRIALKLGKYLKRYGYKVYYTRSNDRFVRLRDRTHYANIKKADLFISIHANAAPKKSQYLTSKGVETYFLSPARSARAKRVSAKENSADMSSMDYYSKQVFLNFLNREKIVASNKLAIDIQRGILKNIRKKYSVVDGGVRKAPFWVLVGAQMPSVLIETGYITNPTEATRLFNPYYENLLAKGIANGIVSYFEKNR